MVVPPPPHFTLNLFRYDKINLQFIAPNSNRFSDRDNKKSKLTVTKKIDNKRPCGVNTEM